MHSFGNLRFTLRGSNRAPLQYKPQSKPHGRSKVALQGTRTQYEKSVFYEPHILRHSQLRLAFRIDFKTPCYMNRHQNVKMISINPTAVKRTRSKKSPRIKIYFVHFNNDSDLNTAIIFYSVPEMQREGTFLLRDVTLTPRTIQKVHVQLASFVWV